MPTRTARLLAALLLLVGAAWPSQGAAATPYLVLTVVASPNPSATGVEVTLTGTVTPVGGSFASVALGMSPLTLDDLDVCTPAPNCTMDASHKRVDWLFPTISSPTVVTATSKGPGPTVSFFVQACDPDDCLVQDASVKIMGPTLSGNVTYSPGGVVVTGAILHFTATGSTDVGPVTGVDVQTDLPGGLGDPTGISAGGVWSPAPARYIDYIADLNLTASYGFDAQVIAPLGSDLKVVLVLWHSSIKAFTKTITIHVGPTATATPRSSPLATAKPPPATATPIPVVSPTIHSASAAASASASAASSNSQSETPSPSASQFASSVESSSEPVASASPGSASNDGPINLRTIAVSVGTGGAVVATYFVLFLRRRRNLP